MIWVEVSPCTLVGITPAFGYLFDQCSVTVRQGVKDLAKKKKLMVTKHGSRQQKCQTNLQLRDVIASGGQINGASRESGEGSDSAKKKKHRWEKACSTTCNLMSEVGTLAAGICGGYAANTKTTLF